VPVPGAPDISDKSSIVHFHNFSHVNYRFGYMSKLHDFDDGYNCFDNVTFFNNKDTEFYCDDNVCLASDFINLGLNFLRNDLHIMDSLARDRSCCNKCVYIFDINSLNSSFACGIEFYFNKYWGNNSHVESVSSNLNVTASFYQILYKFYFHEFCCNIVSILARSLSLLKFDLDLCRCYTAGCYNSVISRHVYIDSVAYDLDFFVSRVFAHFNLSLSAVILVYICDNFYRFDELFFL
jgi:hypothetical protein